MTIPNGIASSSTFGIIEAMPLWIATHSFGMLAMTDHAFIYIGGWYEKNLLSFIPGTIALHRYAFS